MFSSLESNWMESFCRGACLLEYQINTNVYQCCADILHLNFFLDKLEMQEFVRYSVQHAIFIIAMTREEKKWWRLSDEKLCWWYLLKINYLVKTSGYYNDIGWKTKRWGGSYTPNASTNWFAKPRWVESFWLTAWYFVRSSFFLSSRNFDKVKKGSYTCKIDPEVWPDNDARWTVLKEGCCYWGSEMKQGWPCTPTWWVHTEKESRSLTWVWKFSSSSHKREQYVFKSYRF